MQDAFSAVELADGYQLDGYEIESPLSGSWSFASSDDTGITSAEFSPVETESATATGA